MNENSPPNRLRRRRESVSGGIHSAERRFYGRFARTLRAFLVARGVRQDVVLGVGRDIFAPAGAQLRVGGFGPVVLARL